jgi:hypothetical protein
MTIPEIMHFIQSTMTRYERNQHLLPLMDDTKKRTMRVLLQFVQGKELYDQGHYDKALQVRRHWIWAGVGSDVCTP